VLEETLLTAVQSYKVSEFNPRLVHKIRDKTQAPSKLDLTKLTDPRPEFLTAPQFHSSIQAGRHVVYHSAPGTYGLAIGVFYSVAPGKFQFPAEQSDSPGKLNRSEPIQLCSV